MTIDEIDVANEYIAMLEANIKNLTIEKMVLESKLNVAGRKIAALQAPKPTSEPAAPICGETCTCIGDYCVEQNASSK